VLRALQRDIANLRARGQGEGVPVVAPASALPMPKSEYYRDEGAFQFGLAEALGTEYRAIIDAGLDLQVDDALIPYQYEKMVPPMTLADSRTWASLHIALNHALRGCRRTARDTTSAGAAGTVRTCSTCRSKRSSIAC
jgi:5-methyltetrahydropteroyltriglutamate--homocysteine methyltransferase